MPEGGFLEQKPRSPGSLVLVVALHSAAIGALMMAKTHFERTDYDPIIVKTLEETPEPPPIPEPKQEAQPEAPKQRSVIQSVPPEVPMRPQSDAVIGQRTELPVIFDSGPIGQAEEKGPEPLPQPEPVPIPEPVRVEARLDMRSELQPPYPAVEERAQREGSVTVRILIGSDGRVKEIDKVKATSDAFYRATQQQALRHWRFKPATVDGRPVESRTTMTVHFRLSE